MTSPTELGRDLPPGVTKFTILPPQDADEVRASLRKSEKPSTESKVVFNFTTIKCGNNTKDLVCSEIKI